MTAEVWMVARNGVNVDATFGPFDTREDAQAFVDDARRSFEVSGYVGNPGMVYDAAANLASPCGPWRL